MTSPDGTWSLHYADARCPSCFGRGYKTKARTGGKPGASVRVCRRCRGSGSIPATKLRGKEKVTLQGMKEAQ